ncbi:MAG: CoA transferase [Alphaproteobacteria bacterium]|jgi:crotonobetainyl-CoA:carnitine CoA-transferase CaiB-like acyl-CoA transferase|nr:CoA transferase [Alphaproteobacteria bacterium]
MAESTKAAPPLDGVVVLDFTRVLAGPWASLALADLGAKVIKIEHPKTGDDTRRYDVLKDRQGESAYFLSTNRNKESLALDIADDAGKAVVKRLVAKADIVVENFRADVMERQGLGYADLAAINPGLIYCSITGYGHSSPNKMMAGYDPIAQAESGMMWMTGEADGLPLRTGVSYADMFTGMYATQAMLGALRVRDRDGTGQHIDVALLDCATSAVVNYAQLGLLTGNSPKRYGGDHPFIEPLGLYECSDGLISLVCGNERQWEKLCKDGLERPDLLEDPKLTDAATRVANRQYCRDTLGAALKTNTRDHWVPKLRAAGLPVGAVRDVVEALNAPEFRARDMIATTTHARIGEIEQVGSPMKLSRTPVAEPVAPPLLGQHSRNTLAFAGYAADEIEALITSGVVTEETH